MKAVRVVLAVSAVLALASCSGGVERSSVQPTTSTSTTSTATRVPTTTAITRRPDPALVEESIRQIHAGTAGGVIVETNDPELDALTGADSATGVDFLPGKYSVSIDPANAENEVRRLAALDSTTWIWPDEFLYPASVG